MINSELYCVILAGGVGERLWPLSRKHKPKQFLEIENNQTLLDQTIERVTHLVSADNLFISTTQNHQLMLDKRYSQCIGGVIIEPEMRNTGPAILHACMEIYKKNPHAIVLFLSADAYIPSRDTHIFTHYLKQAIEFSRDNKRITLLGVKPTHAATGYGYISYDILASSYPCIVKSFHEKPSLEVAQLYANDASMLWNIGMFCAQVEVFIDEYRKNAPDMYRFMIDYLKSSNSYHAIPANSIDYAVLEKSKDVSVLPVDFSWSDVGSIETYLSLKKNLNDQNDQIIIQTNANNNLVQVSNKLVALIGVSDLCIVETDQVLLITHKTQSQKVKEIVTQLKQTKCEQFL